MQNHEVKKTDTDARQGNHRHMNFRVLIWSLLVIVAAFAAVYMFADLNV